MCRRRRATTEARRSGRARPVVERYRALCEEHRVQLIGLERGANGGRTGIRLAQGSAQSGGRPCQRWSGVARSRYRGREGRSAPIFGSVEHEFLKCPVDQPDAASSKDFQSSVVAAVPRSHECHRVERRIRVDAVDRQMVFEGACAGLVLGNLCCTRELAARQASDMLTLAVVGNESNPLRPGWRSLLATYSHIEAREIGHVHSRGIQGRDQAPIGVGRRRRRSDIRNHRSVDIAKEPLPIKVKLGARTAVRNHPTADDHQVREPSADVDRASVEPVRGLLAQQSRHRREVLQECLASAFGQRDLGQRFAIAE
jgi:hypothetical protein